MFLLLSDKNITSLHYWVSTKAGANLFTLFLSCVFMPQPIGNLAFSLPFMPGGGAEIHPSDIIGLLVILSGLVLYRFGTAIVEILLPATWISSGSLASSSSSLRDDENDLTENLLGDVHDNPESSAGDDGVSV